ncbi:glycoside hydrolase family 3 [Purpureocillium lavendulum]|uniref:Glycoside hydrolase family 3 n=1 Tax=Purpureocillium lavendulum TaxID=1247861 RepID=A0AB34FSA0_9HYPO|nr:glycoside hydrolase family 3 [Purpureocillium lavendulum]
MTSHFVSIASFFTTERRAGQGVKSFVSSSSSSSSDSDASIESTSVAGYRHSMDATATRPVASVEVLRCMRCARAVEATSTDDVSSTGMVRIAHNLYYCERCAKMVGYK